MKPAFQEQNRALTLNLQLSQLLLHVGAGKHEHRRWWHSRARTFQPQALYWSPQGSSFGNGSVHATNHGRQASISHFCVTFLLSTTSQQNKPLCCSYSQGSLVWRIWEHVCESPAQRDTKSIAVRRQEPSYICSQHISTPVQAVQNHPHLLLPQRTASTAHYVLPKQPELLTQIPAKAPTPEQR